MKNRFLAIGISCLSLCLFSTLSYGLGELWEQYQAPQALALGNAFTSDVSGYVSNYYNPAGLAKMPDRKKEWMLFSFDLLGSAVGLGQMLAARSTGIRQISNQLQFSPGDYAYLRFNTLSGFSMRGFGVSLLGSSRYAAVSDGTNIALDSGVDVGPTVGVARNFAGNLVKVGFAGKMILRNQLKGSFTHAELQSDSDIASYHKEGLGIGADLGLLVTLPSKFLPTFGLAWRDIFGTYFRSTHILNSRANGTPEKIPQSVNAAFSLHPHVDRKLRTSFAFELRHIEKVDWPLTKKLHFGFQIENAETSYIWVGLNQLYPTLGFALRLKGGNLEIGTYATDIGEGQVRDSSRRLFMRYTISF